MEANTVIHRLRTAAKAIELKPEFQIRVLEPGVIVSYQWKVQGSPDGYAVVEKFLDWEGIGQGVADPFPRVLTDLTKEAGVLG